MGGSSVVTSLVDAKFDPRPPAMSHTFDLPSMMARGPSFFPAGLDFVVAVGVLPDECNTLFSIADTNPGYEPKAPTNGDRIRGRPRSTDRSHGKHHRDVLTGAGVHEVFVHVVRYRQKPGRDVPSKDERNRLRCCRARAASVSIFFFAMSEFCRERIQRHDITPQSII